MTARRVPALDWFRMAAVILAVMNHTSPLAGLCPGVDFWLTRVLARVAVPFFLMVSGYFLAAGAWRGLKRFWLHTACLYLVGVLLYLPLNLYTGISPAAWLRGLFWEGTVYHLWFFPALLWGTAIAYFLSRLGMPAALGIAGLLYLAGLGGDSYFGLTRQLPALQSLYAALFQVTEYTRNGLFYAPLFLLLGAWLAGSKKRPSPRFSGFGFGISFAAMTAEGLLLHRFQLQRHDSMYLALPVCMVFLFCLLLACNSGRSRAARNLSVLVYLLHPGCIVAVRAIARLTGTWTWLVENSLVHFTAVLLLSLAAAWLLCRLRPIRLPANVRAWRELDTDALRSNAQILKEAAGPACSLMAVVKADAYGHGAVRVARILQRDGVRYFAVACLAEGIALRRAGIRGDILILGWTDPGQAALLARWRLTQTVVSAEHGRELARQGYRIQVHLALDTGMHRIGIPAEDRAALAELSHLGGLRVTGVFSHLCVSDDLSGESCAFTRQQAAGFRDAVDWMKAHQLPTGKVHLLASYGIWNTPEYSFDLVRAGIALYGVRSEDAPTRRTLALQPVLALKARISLVRHLTAGTTAGYGRAFTAVQDTALAVVTIGYADGLPRCLPEKGGRVLVRGISCPMVGRMCMDQLLVDVTGVPKARAGDVVTLIGRDGKECIPVEEIARRCGTITNEILSRLGSRLGLCLQDSHHFPG